MSEAERKRLQKKREEEELFHELWPRETKDEITYSVQVDDITTINLPITQDLMARRFNDAIGEHTDNVYLLRNRYIRLIATLSPHGSFCVIAFLSSPLTIVVMHNNGQLMMSAATDITY
jgi:hypothetical protein